MIVWWLQVLERVKEEGPSFNDLFRELHSFYQTTSSLQKVNILLNQIENFETCENKSLLITQESLWQVNEINNDCNIMIIHWARILFLTFCVSLMNNFFGFQAKCNGFYQCNDDQIFCLQWCFAACALIIIAHQIWNAITFRK
jgi:hypothetical protein